eukprot:TRINITY_DN9469_c0_g1_i1.p1 TRINITY_DN9469_c0_g1~~TRINITY_DN9469_c0_g1_i1.p1  ORF type:complete len:247 (+),score=34.07 TRINITY_DN9469_c0_g1_i1:196-936(+)
MIFNPRFRNFWTRLRLMARSWKGSLFGEDTLQELRISLTLAEMERNGGVSAHVSPFMSLTTFGNLLSRVGYNLPTIWTDKIILKYKNAFELMQHMQDIGESNALNDVRKEVLMQTLLGGTAIYNSLFKDANQEHIVATFETINFLCWKYHESQAKPKKRGSADFSLKTLQTEILQADPDSSKKSIYGEIEVSDESDDEKSSKRQSFNVYNGILTANVPEINSEMHWIVSLYACLQTSSSVKCYYFY